VGEFDGVKNGVSVGVTEGDTNDPESVNANNVKTLPPVCDGVRDGVTEGVK